MSRVKNFGFTDTAFAVGSADITFPVHSLNPVDFKVKSNSPGKEVVITNITSPMDRPEKIRISFSDVANVYSGTGIEPAVMGPTKRGVSVLIQLTQTLSVTDDADPDYRVDLPLSYHLVVKVPASEYVTAEDVVAGIQRLLGGLHNPQSDEAVRLAAILRGSLVPTGM